VRNTTRAAVRGRLVGSGVSAHDRKALQAGAHAPGRRAKHAHTHRRELWPLVVLQILHPAHHEDVGPRPPRARVRLIALDACSSGRRSRGQHRGVKQREPTARPACTARATALGARRPEIGGTLVRAPAAENRCRHHCRPQQHYVQPAALHVSGVAMARTGGVSSFR
jgi:hypothetical protein